MDTGGNAGGQASVTVIRGLSLGEIDYQDVPKVVWKEIRVALLCGLCLGGANFCKLMIFDRTGVLVAFAVCITLVAAVLMAMLVGCLLPIGAKRIGFDPAVMASPFITTIVDALSRLIYCSVARAILGL
jgi:magnesium transporter